MKSDSTAVTVSDRMREDDERIYPCNGCSTMRTKAEGGNVFTLCEECWPKKFPPQTLGEEIPDRVQHVVGLSRTTVAGTTYHDGYQYPSSWAECIVWLAEDRSRLLTALEEKEKLCEGWILACLTTEPPSVRARVFEKTNPEEYTAWRVQVELDLIERAKKAEQWRELWRKKALEADNELHELTAASVLQKEELKQLITKHGNAVLMRYYSTSKEWNGAREALQAIMDAVKAIPSPTSGA